MATISLALLVSSRVHYEGAAISLKSQSHKRSRSFDQNTMVKTGSGKKKAGGHRRLIDDYDGDEFHASDEVEGQKKNSIKKKGSPSPFKKSKSPDRQNLEEGSDGEDTDANNNSATNDIESGDVEDIAATIAADHERMSRSLGTIFDAKSNDDDDDDDESLFSKDEEIEVAFGMPTVTSSGIARNKKSKRGGRRTSGRNSMCCCASRWGRLGC